MVTFIYTFKDQEFPDYPRETFKTRKEGVNKMIERGWVYNFPYGIAPYVESQVKEIDGKEYCMYVHIRKNK